MEKVEKFYRLWDFELDRFLSGYNHDEDGKPNPVRFMFSHYSSLLEKFSAGTLHEIEKINLLSGIRGVGKTTLLAQLYNYRNFISESRIEQSFDKIYVDVSRLSEEGITLHQFFRYYQEKNNLRFVDAGRKLLILLDEVHYDEKWGLFLKNLFDSTKAHKNIMAIATGSSALNIKMNPDLSRRSLTEELYPLKFNEYAVLKTGVLPEAGVSDGLAGAILKSKDAEELYNFCESVKERISGYVAKFPPGSEEEFFYSGGFPFILKLGSKKSIVYELINGVIDKFITKDLLEMRRFNSETISRIKDLLYLIANSDSTDIEKLCSTVKLDYRPVRAVLDALVQSGIIVEMKSYGQKFVKVRKPVKFLFVSPSLRAGILYGVIPPEIRGKILEDYLALIFRVDLERKAKSSGRLEIMHDSSSGGADFVLRLGEGKKIIIEAGYGKKSEEGISQIECTGKRTGGYDYGIIAGGGGDLELVHEKIVKMPLKFWLA